jgi:hypothetical protein
MKKIAASTWLLIIAAAQSAIDAVKTILTSKNRKG